MTRSEMSFVSWGRSARYRVTLQEGPITSRPAAVPFGNSMIFGSSIFKESRDDLAAKSFRQADYAWVVLARVLSVGVDRGKIKRTHAAREGGSDGPIASTTFDARTSSRVLQERAAHLPLLLGLWTGDQRARLGGLIRRIA